MQNRHNRPQKERAKQGKIKRVKQQGSPCKLRILDYRNGKYQGFTLDDTLVKDGLGILIDDNYSFVLGEWKQNKIQGPFFMVYPDESILYGHIQKQKMGEIVCYQVIKQFNMILSKKTDTLIVDFLASSSVLVFKINKKILDQHTVESILQMKQSRLLKQQINTGVALVSEEHYSNLDQKYRIYEKKLSISNLPDYLKSYQLFIKQKFGCGRQIAEGIQIVKTRQDLTVNFKRSAITLFIKLLLQVNQTKILGSVNRYQDQYQFYKKFIHTSSTVQQHVMKAQSPIVTQYSLRALVRPKKCETLLFDLHKGSTTYVNQFVNLKYMYAIKLSMQKINQLINIFVTNKLAQLQLQNTKYHMNQGQSKQKGNRFSKADYTLSEVQQQIYDAVKRKKQSTLNNQLSGRSESRVPQFSEQKRQAQLYPKEVATNNQSSSKNNNSPYLRALNTDYQDIYSSRLNRSKTYVDISNVPRNYQFKPTHKKQTATQKVQQRNIPAKKYAYVVDLQIEKLETSKRTKTPVKYQGYQNTNMRKLTQDYEHIKKQMQLSASKGKKAKSPYRQNNRNTISKGKTNKKGQKSMTQHSPMKQKRTLRYQPY